jgi:hypothetical protein
VVPEAALVDDSRQAFDSAAFFSRANALAGSLIN